MGALESSGGVVPDPLYRWLRGTVVYVFIVAIQLSLVPLTQYYSTYDCSILRLDQVVSYSIVKEFGVTLQSQTLHDPIFVECNRPRFQVQYCGDLLH